MIPLNIGARAHDIKADTPAALCERLAELGLTNTQLAVKKSFPGLVPDYKCLTEGSAAYLGSHFAKAGIKISVLGCYVNISSENPQVRARAVEDFKIHLRLSSIFGANMVGTETGSVKGGYCVENFTEDAYKTTLESVAQMLEYAEHFGASVGIEAGLHHPIHTAKRLRRLLDDIKSPNLRVIYDAANLVTVENHREQEKVFYEGLELLADDIAHMHFKDYIVEDGKLKIVPVGTGLMNYRPMLEFIKKEKPLMSITFEATTDPYIPAALEMINSCYRDI